MIAPETIARIPCLGNQEQQDFPVMTEERRNNNE
jgi:hypothetical protein